MTAKIARRSLRNCPDSARTGAGRRCFPLVPYVNRIRDGRFTFRGREVHLQPNMAGDPSPLHGQGWLNAWTVEEAEEFDAVRYRHEAGEWPWAYEARQLFNLDEGGLWLNLELPQHLERADAMRARRTSLFSVRARNTLDTGV